MAPERKCLTTWKACGGHTDNGRCDNNGSFEHEGLPAKGLDGARGPPWWAMIDGLEGHDRERQSSDAGSTMASDGGSEAGSTRACDGGSEARAKQNESE